MAGLPGHGCFISFQRPEATPNLGDQLQKKIWIYTNHRGLQAMLHFSPSHLAALPGWDLQSLVTPRTHEDQGALQSLGDPTPDDSGLGSCCDSLHPPRNCYGCHKQCKSCLRHMPG